jgi:hypothetical protein
MEPALQLDGGRLGAFADPSGSQLWVASRLEAISPDELKRRIKQQR